MTWGRVLRTFSFLMAGTCTHSHPVSTSDCDDATEAGHTVQGESTTLTLWCKTEIQPFVLLATVLLHRFVTAVFSDYYGMLPSNCPPLRCSSPHVPWSSLRSVSPGSLSNSTTVFIKSEVKVAQSCPTLCDPKDYTVHGILQAKTLEFWVAFPFSRGSSQLRY